MTQNIIGPQHLMRPLQLFHQNCVHSCPTPIQEAVAIGFEIEMERMDNPDSFWKELAEMLEPKRDRMSAFLSSVSMNPTIPEGGYFMIADFSKLTERVDLSSESGTKDYKFVKWLSKTKVWAKSSL